MLKNVKKLHNDESGSYFVELGLALICITLAIVGSVSGIASDGIKPKFEGIKTELDSVDVPTLN